MNRFLSRIRRAWEQTCLPSWTVPLGLLVLLVASFGLLIPRLGFYWDDWPVILTARLRGVGSFWRFYEYNRPLSAWIYVVTVPILGLKPLNWQIFALALRWLTCVSMWWTLTLVWPRYRSLAAWAAFLFAIYPVFSQQSISVAYTQHWTCYLLFFVSMGAMIQAYRVASRSRAAYWALTALAVIAFLLEIFSMEYFTGLELLRPALLWIVASEQIPARKRRAWAVLKHWTPYLAGAASFVVWRFFFMKLAREDVNSPRLLGQLLSAPVDTVRRFVEMAIQDLLVLFARAWSNLLNTPIDLSDRFLLVSWGVAILAAAATFVYLSRLGEPQGESPKAGEPGVARRLASPVMQGLLLGAAAAVLGILPVWTTDRQMTAGMYADRFGLAAMFGTSLFLASLIDWLIKDRRRQLAVLSLLVGLAVGYHIQTANAYRWSWVRQTRFYWQLKWRAPQLQPKTAIFSEGEIFMYMGLYPTSAAVNMLYLDHMPAEDLSYWFFSLGRNFAYSMDKFTKGIAARSTLRNYVFQGNTRNGIAIQYEASNDCLEVLEPADFDAPGLGDFTRRAVAVSDLSRISAEPGPVQAPPGDIFGPEPEHGWCYLYEKASLARQLGDWNQVVALGEQAKAQGYHPKSSSSNTPLEWLPFIEGYARAGRWEEAQALSLEAYNKDQRIDARMCRLWKGLGDEKGNDPAAAKAVKAVRNQVKCPE